MIFYNLRNIKMNDHDLSLLRERYLRISHEECRGCNMSSPEHECYDSIWIRDMKHRAASELFQEKKVSLNFFAEVERYLYFHRNSHKNMHYL